MLSTAQKIEGLLFYKGEPTSIKELSKILKLHEGEIADAIEDLRKNLENRGITLIKKDDMISLATVGALSELINEIRKEELTKELSKASLETLSIILYKNGATRSEIDYIRGVNSSFILRNLSVRGMVERITDKIDSRKYVYRPTFDLLSFMGLNQIENLPDFENISSTLLKEMYNNNENKETNDNVEK